MLCGAVLLLWGSGMHECFCCVCLSKKQSWATGLCFFCLHGVEDLPAQKVCTAMAQDFCALWDQGQVPNTSDWCSKPYHFLHQQNKGDHWLLHMPLVVPATPSLADIFGGTTQGLYHHSHFREVNEGIGVCSGQRAPVLPGGCRTPWCSPQSLLWHLKL